MALYRTDKDKIIRKVAGNVGSGYAKADKSAANLSEADILNWQRKLGIWDKEQLSEVISNRTKRYLIERWELPETNTWYEIYNDGYKKCGGIGLGQNITHTITFPIAFTNTNYLVKLTGIANNSVSTSCVLGVVNTLRTETQMKIQSVEFGYGYYWEAEGY